MRASQYGRIDCVELLLKAGANADTKDDVSQYACTAVCKRVYECICSRKCKCANQKCGDKCIDSTYYSILPIGFTFTAHEFHEGILL
jgi:hypothetical protein